MLKGGRVERRALRRNILREFQGSSWVRTATKKVGYNSQGLGSKDQDLVMREGIWGCVVQQLQNFWAER